MERTAFREPDAACQRAHVRRTGLIESEEDPFLASAGREGALKLLAQILDFLIGERYCERPIPGLKRKQRRRPRFQAKALQNHSPMLARQDQGMLEMRVGVSGGRDECDSNIPIRALARRAWLG